MQIDLEEIRQKAQRAITFEQGFKKMVVIDAEIILGLLDEIDQGEKERAEVEDDAAHLQDELTNAEDSVSDLECEVEDLRTERDDLKEQIAELVRSSECQECRARLPSLCNDCYYTGGR